MDIHDLVQAYRSKTDEELLQLAADPEQLTPEAQSALTGELVMELLVTVAREDGTTVVLVTHEPRVAAYADREVIVRDGQVSSLTADPPAL